MQNIADYIPEVQYDITARVIPGFAFIGLVQIHYPNWMMNDQAFGFASYLVASYIVGFLIEQVLVKLESTVLRWFTRKFLKSIAIVDDLWTYYNNCSDKSEKAVFLKKMGERTMFLSLALVSLSTYALPLRIYNEFIYGNLYMPALLFVLCINAFYHVSRGATHHLVRAKK